MNAAVPSAPRHVGIILTTLALSTSHGCDGSACSDRSPPLSASEQHSASSRELSTMDLLDIVRQYYYHPLTRAQLLANPDIFDRLELTPQYQAWRAARKAGWDKWSEWNALVEGLEPVLLSFKVRNESMPGMSCYEAGIYTLDPRDPLNNRPFKHGDILVSLIVRVSFFAPVYEMYETHSKVTYKRNARLDDDGNKRHSYEYHHRTHDISPRYRPAADAFARAIEAQYGYELADPDVLNIELVNTAMWEEQWYTGTLGKALFSEYRL